MRHASPRRPIHPILRAIALAAVGWGALAFGAVYPWAFLPLAVVTAAVGAASLAVERKGRPPIGGLALGLAAIGAAIVLQLVPLPPGVLSGVSPHAESFRQRYERSYGVLRPVDTQGTTEAGDKTTEWTPSSLAPQNTEVGLVLFSALAIFLLGMTRLLSVQGASPVVRALVILGVGLALIGIVQQALSPKEQYLFRVYGFWQTQFQANPFGPFINRNHFAGWIVMCFPLALMAAYSIWEQSFSEWHGMDFREWLSVLSSPAGAGFTLMIFASAVMALALLLSQSRSGAAALVAGGILCATAIARRQSTKRSRASMAIATAVLLLIVSAWAGIDRISARVSSVSDAFPTMGGRSGAWIDTLQIIRDFPVTGTGFNTYGTAMNLYQSRNRELHFREAHNEYLQIAAEGGLLLVVPVFFTVGVFLRMVRRRFREAPRRGTTYWLRVGAVIGLLSIALQSLVDFSLQMPGNAALFALLAAIALHQSPKLQRSSPPTRADLGSDRYPRAEASGGPPLRQHGGGH